MSMTKEQKDEMLFVENVATDPQVNSMLLRESKEYQKHLRIMISLANDMNALILEKYGKLDRTMSGEGYVAECQKRFNKTYNRFRVLHDEAYGLFDSALHGTLNDGEEGSIINIFKQFLNSPDAVDIDKEVGNYWRSKSEQEMKDEMNQKEAEKIQSIIEKMEQNQ